MDHQSKPLSMFFPLCLLFITITVPEVQAACDYNEDNVVPFPPSLLDLPDLRLLEYNGKQFKLACELLVCSITHPVTFTWMFAHNEDLSDAKELTHEGHEAASSTRYHFEDDSLYIHPDIKDWTAITGYYWCEAENEHGKATSNKCHIDKTGIKQRFEDLPLTEVMAGESVQLEMAKDPPSDDDVPLIAFYSIKWDNTKATEILKPKVTMSNKNGRFVIGANFDLYVLDAKTTDSSMATLNFREYGTLTTFAYRQAPIKVLNAPFQGVNEGFFDIYKNYVFVRGVESFVTCIPRSNTKVLFKKDGKAIDVSYDQGGSMFRTDYGLWFKSISEKDAGKYTCYLEEDPSVEYSQTIKVIGSPKLDCDFEVFIIEVPKSNLNQKCTVSSKYLELNKPVLQWNNAPIEEATDLSIKSVIKESRNDWNIDITSERLSEGKDTGVLRITASAEPQTREQILRTVGFTKDFDKIHFQDYRLLSFESRREVSISVFTQKLKVNPLPNQRLDALMGEKGFILRTTIFGSPVPEVTWYIDGIEVEKDDQKYSFSVRFSVVFMFTFREIESNYTLKAVGRHQIEGQEYTAEDNFKVIAHKPLEWKGDLKNEYNTFTGQEAKAICAATQKAGARTANIEFTWLLAEDGSFIFDGNEGYKIETGEVVENGIRYGISTLKYMTSEDSERKFLCNATLIANGNELQTLSRDVSVASGNKPGTPKDLSLDGARRRFEYQSERVSGDYDVMDVMEYAQVFQETKANEIEWKILGTTQQRVGRDGWVDVKISLSELTMDYQEEEWFEFPPGSKFLFRVYTKNKFGKSDNSNQVDYVSDDALPTAKVENVAVKPADDDSGKVVVSWDPYPREDFGSYEKDGCCMHVEIVATSPEFLKKTETLDCVDPSKTEVETGWDDMDPYTKHEVKVWFSNDAGETEPTEAEGYNHQTPPAKPKLAEAQDEDARSITVDFDAMSDADIHGKFEEYELIIRDEAGEIVGKKSSTDQGTPGEQLSLTVDGLTPYKKYTAELVVKNEVASTSTGEIPRQTKAAPPDAIDPDSVRVQVHPEGVVIFWKKPEDMNGDFDNYLLKFNDKLPGGGDQTTKETEFDATSIFFPDGIDKDPVAETDYPFELFTKNHEYTSDPTPSQVPFKLPVDTPPGNPQPPKELVCGFLDPTRLSAKWTYEQFGDYASTHSVIYKVHNTEAEYNESCKGLKVTDEQECFPGVERKPYVYMVKLLARNKYGSAASQSELCKANFTAMAALEGGDGVLAAGAGLIFALLLLLLLLILLVIIGIYYAKNRSHNYRVQRNESRFKPKDIEFLPRKDETNMFNEYVPDETKLPFISPHKRTGPLDLDDDSFNDPFGGDDDLDGYNEDGSFIGAYTNDAV